MDLKIIKQALRLVGINNLAVRFDDPNRQIVATFRKDSQGHSEFIKFTDIEDLFTGSMQAPSVPVVDAAPPAADRHPPDDP